MDEDGDSINDASFKLLIKKKHRILFIKIMVILLYWQVQGPL